jgi:hypothetical protein
LPVTVAAPVPFGQRSGKLSTTFHFVLFLCRRSTAQVLFHCQSVPDALRLGFVSCNSNLCWPTCPCSAVNQPTYLRLSVVTSLFLVDSLPSQHSSQMVHPHSIEHPCFHHHPFSGSVKFSPLTGQGRWSPEPGGASRPAARYPRSCARPPPQYAPSPRRQSAASSPQSSLRVATAGWRRQTFWRGRCWWRGIGGGVHSQLRNWWAEFVPQDPCPNGLQP